MTGPAHAPPLEPDLRWALGAVRRRLWPLATFVVAGTVLAAALSLQLTPRFSVKATILLDPRPLRLADTLAVRSELVPAGAAMRTELALLRSRPFLIRVVDRLRLAGDPAFNGEAEARRDWLRRLRVAWQQLRGRLPSHGYPTSDTLARAHAVATLERALTVQNPDDSYLIDVGVRGPDPERIAAIANTVADLYVDERRDAQQAARRRASQWLRRRLPQLAAVAEVAERAVAEHAQLHGLVTVVGADLNDQQMQDLDVELAQARADLSARQALADMVQEQRRLGGDAASLAEVGASPVIVALRQREARLRRQEGEFRTLYGDRHPRMRELQQQVAAIAGKVDVEVARIVRRLDNDAHVAAARVASLERERDGLRSVGREGNEAAIRLRELQRDAEVAGAAYDAVLRRTNELADADRLDDVAARVITTATAPVVPRPPGRKLVTIAGFTVSTLLGTLLALMVEAARGGLRSVSAIRDALGLPILGTVPRLGRRAMRRLRHLQPVDGSPSAYDEAIRSIAFNLHLLEQDVGGRVLLVTSGLPCEGRTTLALALAGLLVRRGRRVLVVDADRRRPGVHQQLRSTAPQGLMQRLEQRIPLSDVTYRDPATGIEFVPSGGPAGRRHEPLQRGALAEMITEARGTFEVVIIDAPPLSGGSDAPLLAELVDDVIVAVRWGTRPVAARDGIEALRNIDAEPTGLVLTMVDPRHTLASRTRSGPLARWGALAARLSRPMPPALPSSLLNRARL